MNFDNPGFWFGLFCIHVSNRYLISFMLISWDEFSNMQVSLSILLIYPIISFVQLAARIVVSNLHKNTKKSFSET